MRIFLRDAHKRPLAESFIRTGTRQRSRQHVQVRDLEHKIIRDQRQTLRRERDDFIDIIQIRIADAFQPRLHDLLEAVCALRNAIDILVVVDLLLDAGHVFTAADDGQRHVRLERQQLPVRVVEGDDAVADEKVLVADIEVIFFKLAHPVRQIAVSAIEVAQAKDRGFFTPEQFFIQHGRPPLRSARSPAGNRRFRIHSTC